MVNVKCAECGEETKDEDVFSHQGEPYCCECTVKHLEDKHGRRTGVPVGANPTEDAKIKHGPEGKRTHTYSTL